MKQRRMTGLLLAAVLAFSSCQTGFTAFAEESSDVFELPAEDAGVYDEDIPADAEAFDEDGFFEDAETLEDEFFEDAGALVEENAIVPEGDLSESLIEEAAEELADDGEESFAPEAVSAYADAYTVTAKCWPQKWGSICAAGKKYKEYEIGLTEDGSIIDRFYSECASVDKLCVDYYELNGTVLKNGETCRYNEDDGFPDERYLEWVDPSLLTDGENILRVVFTTNPLYMMSMRAFSFIAGEGGMLSEYGSDELTKSITNFTTYPESIDFSWSVLSLDLTGVPDEGYIFTGWADKNGKILSYTGEDSSFFLDYLDDAPFTATFEKLSEGNLVVRADPSAYGSISYLDESYNMVSGTRFANFPITENGTLGSVIYFDQEPTDKLSFSHWELNGTKLVGGVNCQLVYDEIDTYIDIGIAAVSPDLLTGNDVLRAVFVPTMYATAITGFNFTAGEGGSLRANDWSEPYNVLTCYAGLDSIDNGYKFYYNKITAVPDEGWTFAAWKDKNGNVISTDASVSNLEEVFGVPFGDGIFANNNIAPFTAVFEKALPAGSHAVTAKCWPALWGDLVPDSDEYCKEYEFAVNAEGHVSEYVFPEPASIDKLSFDYYELNGTKLVNGQNCRYLNNSGAYYTNALEWVDPSLLSDGKNTLKVVFTTNPMYMMSMRAFSFIAGEGGMLSEYGSDELTKSITNFTTYPESIDFSWSVLSLDLTGVPDEGYIFTGWADKNGKILSYTGEDSSFFLDYLDDAPFTATFEKLHEGNLVVRADPSAYGSISYLDESYNMVSGTRFENFPITENGTLKTAIYFKREPTDKLNFSHWELNGTKLVGGVNCQLAYDEIDTYIDIGIEAVSPDLLTGNDVLRAVFVPTMYATGIVGFDFTAGEGGSLRANDWSEPYNVLTCYAGLDSIDNGYKFYYNKITAVPDEGWTFAAWKDKNGNVISTDASVSNLEEVFGVPFGDGIFANNNIAPFTAVFEKKATETAYTATAKCWPAKWGTLYSYSGSSKECEIELAADGSIIRGFYADPESVDKLLVDYYELNGTKLVNGETCRYYDDEGFSDEHSLEWVDPSLLTDGDNILRVVFTTNPMYMTPMHSFFYIAGEGGMLSENGSDELQKSIINFTTYPETIDFGWSVLSDYVIAVPDEGYTFVKWVDKNGNTLSTDEAFGGPFELIENSPFTAVFEKEVTETISGSTGDGVPASGDTPAGGGAPASGGAPAAAASASSAKKDMQALDEKITKTAAESADSEYRELALRTSSVKKTSVTMKWNKVEGATGYVVYGSKSTDNFQHLDMVTALEYTAKGLAKKTDYKFKVAAVKVSGNKMEVLSISKVICTTTAGGKKGNAKKIALKSKSRVKLKSGKSSKIRASAKTAVGKKLGTNRKLRYESSDPTVATVSSNGKIKAVGAGTCTIYVYAQNGISKKITVKVK